MIGKVLVFCPTYKGPDGCLAIQPETLSKIQSLNFSHKFDIEISDHNPYPVPDHQNVLAQYQLARKMALDGGYDALMTIEHDVLVPPDALQKLWELNTPVAYGIYLFRGYRNIVNVFRLKEPLRPNMAKYRIPLAQGLRDQIAECHGAGMGCLLIRRSVLEKIEFRTTPENTAPDFPFANDCKAMGIRQIAHFGVQCGHIINGRALYLDIRFADGTKRISAANRKPWVRSAPTLNRLQIAIFNRGGKADGLREALLSFGHKVVSPGEEADALLIDHDMDQYSFRKKIDPYYKEGKPVFLFPHGAPPILSWDGIHKPYKAITANLVTAPGQAEVMRRYGYDRPIQVIGWYYCELKPFQSTQGLKVLFGPIHPMKGGSFSYPEDEQANRETFERLLKIPGIDLTVRYIGDLAVNGLRSEPGVKYQQVKPTNNLDDIDRADMVVSNGTLAYLAIARGKPTVMFNQYTGARDLVGDKTVRVKSLDKYSGYMRYPFDVNDSDDLEDIIRVAGISEPVEWKRLFIGEQLKPDQFCRLLGKLITDHNKPPAAAVTAAPPPQVIQPAPAPDPVPAKKKEKGIYYLHRHQGKEQAFTRALTAAGYRFVGSVNGRLSFAMGDLDGSRTGNGEVIFRDWLIKMRKHGIPVFLYPHAARPMVQWDGLLVPWRFTACTFVIAEGHAEVMRRFGYPIKTAVVGWPLCEIKPFKPVEKISNVLFGPIHPAANGWLADVDIDINKRTFDRLFKYCQEIGATLTIRHIQPLERNGIKPNPRVQYVRARPNGSTAEIDQADLVVGHQTFAYLAVARGKPVLMMGEDTPPHSGMAQSNLRFVEHWDNYRDYLRYPLDVLDGDTSNVVERARLGCAEVEGWKSKFIGAPFSPSRFIRTLESYL